MYLFKIYLQRRAAQEKERQLSPRSREVLAREPRGYIDPATLPPAILQQYGPLSSTPQGILYAPPPGQVPASAQNERGSGARTTSPMPPRDATPPRAEERAASVGSPWPPQHHIQGRPGHPQHSPGGVPGPGGSRPGEHPRHTPPPRGGVIHRSITQGTVIMEPRVSEASPFATLVDVAVSQQHVSVPSKDRVPQLSPAPRGEPPKDSRSEQMSKVLF